MEARQLQLAFEARAGELGLGALGERVEIEEVGQRRDDQQRRVDLGGGRGAQDVRFGAQVVEHVAVHGGAAHGVAHLPLHVHGLGEGAQVQADHGVFQPAPHVADQLGGGLGAQVERIGGGIEQDEFGRGHGHVVGRRNQRAV